MSTQINPEHKVLIVTRVTNGWRIDPSNTSETFVATDVYRLTQMIEKWAEEQNKKVKE